jgi:hypothetical protein
VFIPYITDSSWTLASGSTVMKCLDNCPSKATNSAYLRILTTISSNIPSLSSNTFYNTEKEYCTSSCSVLGGSSKVNIFTDQNSQLTCAATCPPTVGTESSLSNTDNATLIYYDAEHTNTITGHNVCTSSCSFYFTDTSSRSRCASSCVPIAPSLSFTTPSMIFKETASSKTYCKSQCATDLYHRFLDSDFVCEANCNTARSKTSKEYF